MLHRSLPLAFLVLLFTAASALLPSPTPVLSRSPLPVPRCGKPCRFTICGFRRALIANPQLPVTRPICERNGRDIGQILSVQEARVAPRRMNSSVRISRLRFKGDTPYPANFFWPVRTELALPNVSSLAVRFVPRGAMENLQGACVRVPIRRWVENGVERSGKGCVAFNVQVPTVMVELTWDSNDDLDLFVVEPDGTPIFFQQDSGSGQLLRDVGRRNCGRRRRVGGKETIVYFAKQVVQPGRYFVFAEHTRNCLETATGWEVRVIVRGRIARWRSGVSRLREGGRIEGSAVSFVV